MAGQEVENAPERRLQGAIRLQTDSFTTPAWNLETNYRRTVASVV
jgi:hypothetical protein